MEVSTHREVLDEVVSPEDDFKMFEESVDSAPLEKVLGMAYSFSGDAFSFMINKEQALKEVRMRREMLSLVASIFDPLGLAAPCTLRGKLIFQRVTQLETGWDEPLTADLVTEFDEWRQSLPDLEKLKVPR